jgi:hypothetical protein
VAKGQKRGNREAKKPKAVAKKPPPGTLAEHYQFPGQRPSNKPSGK